MAAVKMYTTNFCPFCKRAEMLLKLKGVTNIQKINIDAEPHLREEMMTITGRRTVPQIFIGQTHVGGFDDLSALDKAGGLAALLEQA